MPTFTNRPPDDPRGHGLEIFRTPTAKPLHAIVTCDDLAGCPTHYYSGRTLPCETPDCEPCKKGNPWRWHAYLSALMKGSLQHFIFEMTARVADHFVAYRKEHGTLRNCLFTAWRPKKLLNARVSVTLKPAGPIDVPLPEPPDVIKALSILWNIAEPHIDVAELLRDMPRIRVDSSGNGETVDPLDLVR